MEPKDYLHIDELAALLGRSPRTLHRWHTRRVGPPRIKIGTLVVYRRIAVEQWLARNERAGGRPQ